MTKEFRGEFGDIAETLTEQHDNMQSGARLHWAQLSAAEQVAVGAASNALMIAAQNLRAVACGLYAPAGQQPIDKAWAAVLPPLKETDK